MIVLASSSPRRAALLQAAGIPHEVCLPPDALEERHEAGWATLDPKATAGRLALLKALSVARGSAPGCLVLGADTVVSFRGQMLGKPESRAEAQQMLRSMAGEEHQVITGLSLVRAGSGLLLGDVVCTRVLLKPRCDEAIEDYLEAGLGDGKAGAYGIQDALFGPMLERIEGSFDNVVGLPIEALRRLLKQASEDECACPH